MLIVALCTSSYLLWTNSPTVDVAKSAHNLAIEKNCFDRSSIRLKSCKPNIYSSLALKRLAIVFGISTNVFGALSRTVLPGTTSWVFSSTPSSISLVSNVSLGYFPQIKRIPGGAEIRVRNNILLSSTPLSSNTCRFNFSVLSGASEWFCLQ